MIGSVINHCSVVRIGINITCSRNGFYSDVVECLPVDLAAQVRIPPRADGIFLHHVTAHLQLQSPACSKYTKCLSSSNTESLLRNEYVQQHY